MKDTSRNIDRKKVYVGLVLLCTAVLLMLVGQGNPSLFLRIFWVILLGVGILLYLWGRFFSRGSA